MPRALIIPDVHHDIPWVDRIIAAEQDVDRIFFLGDYFDAYKPKVGALRVMQVMQRVSEECDTTFLVGNHDLQYLFGIQAGFNARNPYRCSGFSQTRAFEIAVHAPKFPWLNDIVPFAVFDGFLLNHAGFDARLVHPDGLAATLAAAQDSLDDLPGTIGAPYWMCGECRGGHDPYSGFVWQDWDEFKEGETEYPQIVGHSGRPMTGKLDGPSYCLDNNQTTYGALTDGVLEVKTA